MVVLKVEVLDVQSKSFIPQREALSWEFPPCFVVLCQGLGLCQECVALPTLIWVFSHSLDREESFRSFLDFFQSEMLHL